MADRQSGGNDGAPAAAQQVVRDRVEDGHHLTVVTGQLGEQRPGDRRRSGGFGVAGGVELGGSQRGTPARPRSDPGCAGRRRARRRRPPLRRRSPRPGSGQRRARGARRSPGPNGSFTRPASPRSSKPSGSSQRSLGNAASHSAHHLRRNLDVAVPTARGQNLRRPLPIGVGETEAERTIEAVALDQCVDASRDGATQLVAGDGVTDDATPQVVDRELAVVRDADQRQWGQHRGRIDVILADRTTQQVGVATADGGRDRQHVPLGVVEVIEAPSRTRISSAPRMPYAAATDAAAGHPPVDVGTEASTPCCAASVDHLGRREQQLCFADLEHRARDAQLRQPAHTGRGWPARSARDEGASVTSRPSRRPPSSFPQTWCASSTTTHTPSGHRLPSSASSQAADTGRVVGARSMPAAAAMRRRKCAGERSAGVVPTRMSVPRGARSFSAIIWESSTDLPNPGPPTTNTARVAPSGCSSVRPDEAEPPGGESSDVPLHDTLRSDRPDR